MLSAAFSLAIIPVEIEASAILLNGGNENICKDIHNSLNSVFIFSFGFYVFAYCSTSVDASISEYLLYKKQWFPIFLLHQS